MKYILLIVAIVIGDQITKLLTMQMIPMGGYVPVFPGFASFTYVQNTGAAFSLFGNATLALAIVSAVMSVVIIYLLLKFKDRFHSTLYNLAMTFIAAGAIGNCIDRFFRGYVVDMIQFDFVNFAVFNVADCFVTFGAVMLGVFVIWFWDADKKKKKAAVAGPTGAETEQDEANHD